MKLSLKNLKTTSEDRERKAFYASDYGKSNLDLYFSWMNEPRTNPIKWKKELLFGSGNGVEENFLNILKHNGYVQEDYDQREHGRVEMYTHNIDINGYVDVILKDGTPMEIKASGSYYNLKNTRNNTPRESYVGQLATYMEYLGKDKGYLFVASLDGSQAYLIECKKTDDYIYQCGETSVNLSTEWLRWAKLHQNHIIPEEMPDIWEYRYKDDVDEIDWRGQTSSNISKARNNHIVLGDYQVHYSPWKDKIRKLQGDTKEYTEKEIMKIISKTKGYTNW
jgi:hypothetical protein